MRRRMGIRDHDFSADAVWSVYPAPTPLVGRNDHQGRHHHNRLRLVASWRSGS